MLNDENDNVRIKALTGLKDIYLKKKKLKITLTELEYINFNMKEDICELRQAIYSLCENIIL